jgi:hydrogenase maturation protease
VSEQPGRPAPGLRIIGIGNEFAGDDAAGLLVARALAPVLAGDAEVVEQSGEGAALMAAWEGAPWVILCDALRGADAPGRVYRFDARDRALPQELRPCSSHAFGVAEAIELARELGTLPPRLVVYGIAGRQFHAGTERSPEAEAAVAEAARQIEAEVRGRSGAS